MMISRTTMLGRGVISIFVVYDCTIESHKVKMLENQNLKLYPALIGDIAHNRFLKKA